MVPLKLLDELRAIKTPEEIQKIRKGCRIVSETFASIFPKILPGLTEKGVAKLIEEELARRGAEALAFPILVAAGSHAANPHHHPTYRKLALGEFCFLDFGAVVGGYCSDFTRTIFLGRPNAEQRRLYNVVLKAQEATLALMERHDFRQGLRAKTVDGIARTILKQAGLGRAFRHNTGHGLGYTIHEWPSLGPKTLGPPRCHILKPGMVVTVEPGIYLRSFGGIRIEDTVLIRERGIEVLTKGAKKLEEVTIGA